MKKFILTLTIFLSITLLGIIVILLLPQTPFSADSMLMGSLQKDSLIAKTPEKRIIFIGGSNLPFGLDSQMIKDSLNFNPVNMGIHAGIGLKYMLEEAQPHIKESDVVVIIPEYHQFYGDQVYGQEVLGQMALDINRSIFKHFNFNQWMMFIKNIPVFIEEKVYYRSYMKPKEENKIPYYSKDAFNKYGDAYKHWNIEFYHGGHPPMPRLSKYNPHTIEYIQAFIDSIPKQTRVYISFPAFQDQSFTNSEEEINKIYSVLVNSKIKLLGNPERYKISNEYLFDTPYHLVKKGAELRTKLLIEDLKKNEVSNK